MINTKEARGLKNCQSYVYVPVSCALGLSADLCE